MEATSKSVQSTPFPDTLAVTVRGAGNEDQPASMANDSLGFKPYVEAVYSYLKNPLTKAPFTLSIEGDWGAGKSSFMCQLEESLKNDKQKTIKFNAWRHDKVESMWAAFALHFIKELLHELSWYSRIYANVRLRWKRFNFSKGWFSLLKTFVLAIFYVYILYTLISFLHGHSLAATFEKDKLNWNIITTAFGSAGVVLGILFFFGKVSEFTGNPFKSDLAKFVTTPSYAGNVAFIEEFHRDFDQTVNVLSDNKSKIFIFIDDLDRADVPKAAELMQGLNMMISNSSRLIFIIGMDREKVAAGIAAKYKDLLPFLNPNQGALNTVSGLEQAKVFGYQFLEKFIQLSFALPKPSPAFTSTFIDSLSGIKPSNNDGTSVHYNPILTIADGDDSKQFREVTKLLAPFFDDNPRRIKQFVNAFRLKAHIANSTGLFNETEGNFKAVFAITIPQLGKFIAMLMLWPSLAEALVENINLFDSIFYKNNDDFTSEWSENEQFVRLLELEPEEDGQDRQQSGDYNMANLNILPLLETLPPSNNDTKNDSNKNAIPPVGAFPNDSSALPKSNPPLSGSSKSFNTSTTKSSATTRRSSNSAKK